MPLAETPPKSAFLETIRIQHAGPLRDFTLSFRDPVTVVAGPNSSSKTTILLAASSAYNPNHINQPGLFDPLLPRQKDPASEHQPSLEFTYSLDREFENHTVILWESMTKTDQDAPPCSTYLKTLGHLSSVTDITHHAPQWAAALDAPTVPVLHQGTFQTANQLEELCLHLLAQPSALGPEREGLVVRTSLPFQAQDFASSVCKVVRPGHVQPDQEHWSKHWQPCELTRPEPDILK